MIELRHVSRSFELFRSPGHRLAGALGWSRLQPDVHWALRDIDLVVAPGEVLGIVGPNGSGKSTLLQVVSGILKPTKGSVTVEGRVAAILELGAGFNAEFTGRENVLLSARLKGITADASYLAAIEEFAELGRYFDRPVKEYSSGMYVRLAFAAATHDNPDILIVDEALAVGDARFAARCVRKFEEFAALGKTILFVSHDLGLVKRLSHRAALIWKGSLAALDRPSVVCDEYVARVLSDEPPTAREDASRRPHGDGVTVIEAIRLLNAAGASQSTFQAGETVTVELSVRAREHTEQWMAGLLIRDRLGIDVYGTNSKVEGIAVPPLAPGELVRVRFHFPCHLSGHDYSLTIATQHEDGRSQDWRDDVISFSVVEPKAIAGYANLHASIEVSRCA